MPSFDVTNKVSFEQVLTWGEGPCDYTLRASAMLGPLALPAATTKAATHANREVLKVRLPFTARRWRDALETGDRIAIAKRLGSVVVSPLGWSLVSVCERITTSDDVNIAPELKRVLVRQRERGILGMGTSCTLLYHDGALPPPALLPDPLEEENPEIFRTLVKELDWGLMGGKQPGSWKPRHSPVTNQIGTLLFEGLRNAKEHGNLSEAGAALDAPYGVTLEKYRFPDLATLSANPAFGPVVQEFAARRAVGPKGRVGFTVYSVFDCGPGIHATAPSAATDPWERLHEAFRAGVTRKASFKGNSGFGLTELVAAVAEMRGLLVVKSAGVVGYCDLSAPVGQEFLNTPRFTAWPTPCKHTRGTVVSVVLSQSPEEQAEEFVE